VALARAVVITFVIYLTVAGTCWAIALPDHALPGGTDLTRTAVAIAAAGAAAALAANLAVATGGPIRVRPASARLAVARLAATAPLLAPLRFRFRDAEQGTQRTEGKTKRAPARGTGREPASQRIEL
jgi:hypothetical protein